MHINVRASVAIFSAVFLAALTLSAQTGSTTAPAKPSPSGPAASPSSYGTQPTILGAPSTGANVGISGRVVPNQLTRVAVELYQDGIRLDTTYTGSDGSFRFPRQMSDRRYDVHVIMPDGQEVSQMVDFMGQYPATVQLSLAKVVKSDSDAKPASGTVSVANLSAPKKAQQEFEKAVELAEKKKFDDAMTHFHKATDIYAKYPAAYNEMGQVERAQNHAKEAAVEFQKAIDADPKWVVPYVNLAQVQLTSHEIEPMMKTNEKALALDPTLAMPNYFNAVGYLTMGRLEDAEKSALAAERTDQGRTPQIQLVLAHVYDARHDVAGALAHYKRFLKESPHAANAPQISARVAEMEKAEAKP